MELLFEPIKELYDWYNRNCFCRYEVQAIQQAIITSMAMEASEIKGVYEVEMSETRPNLTSTGGPATP